MSSPRDLHSRSVLVQVGSSRAAESSRRMSFGGCAGRLFRGKGELSAHKAASTRARAFVSYCSAALERTGVEPP